MGRRLNIEREYHYFYKITNNINGKFYYGIHSTDDMDDGYMGSGVILRKAYEKYGIENFTKEIIKTFNTREECSDYESNIINEGLIRNAMCYNMVRGGDTLATSGMLTVKDTDDNVMLVFPDDERWINGELVGSTKGFVNCFDKEKQCYTQVKRESFFDNRDRYCGLTSNFVVCRLKGTNDKMGLVNMDAYQKNHDLYETPSSNHVTCKDKEGNIFRVSTENEDYKRGKLKPIWYGVKHSNDTKKKMSETHRKNGDQQGEKNSQFGTCWITKDGINKKIKKEDIEVYLIQGWNKGRVCNKES